jgi:hypothetical protein
MEIVNIGDERVNLSRTRVDVRAISRKWIQGSLNRINHEISRSPRVSAFGRIS